VKRGQPSSAIGALALGATLACAATARADGLEWKQRGGFGRVSHEHDDGGWYARAEWLGGADGAGMSLGLSAWRGDTDGAGVGAPIALRAALGDPIWVGLGAGLELVHVDRLRDRTGVGLLAPFAIAEIGVRASPWLAVVAELRPEYRWKSFGTAYEQGELGFGLALEVPLVVPPSAPEDGTLPVSVGRGGYGPDCYEGAPRSDDNHDCPLPLATGDPYNPWDDLFEWGYTLRVGWAPPAMGGIGFAVRHFPARAVGFELGGDVFGGVDPQGVRRTELPLAADALLFFHRGSFLQAYALGGAGVSLARVQHDPEHVERRGYFGPRLGAGVQLKGARDLGWSFDLVGFARTPIDGADDSERLSAGALVRASGTFYPHD